MDLMILNDFTHVSIRVMVGIEQSVLFPVRNAMIIYMVISLGLNKRVW